MVTIAVDAMGGDNAPRIEVEGAIAASRAYGVKIILVGRQEAVRTELEKHSGWDQCPIEVVHASEVITMDDSAAKAVRSKKDSSIRVASRLVRDGLAHGVVSAGNTGAVMATAKMVQGIVHGVERPSLAATLPTRNGHPAVLLDVGANVDSSPRMLAQFAVMGEIYSRSILRRESPRVGLLSIGEEDSKGNDLVVEVNGALRKSRLNFIGNVEGKDLTRGVADIVVMDGFTGNVVLKTAEGIAELMFGELRKAVELTPWNRAAGLILMSELRKVKRRLDYTEYGGAQLLGVEGVTVIGHGRSNARAVFSAIRAARDSVQNGVLGQLREIAKEIPAKRAASGEDE